MTIHLHQGDLPEGLDFGASVAIDTETMGLNPARDRLCLVQLSAGNGICHMVQIPLCRPDRPHPLFSGFIRAAVAESDARRASPISVTADGRHHEVVERAAAEKALILGGPCVGHRRHALVELVHDRIDHVIVVGHERRVEGHVLERHLRKLPERADPTHVRKADLDGFERLLELVKRAAVRFGPTNAVWTADRLEPPVRLGHDERVHDPHPR